MYVRSLVEQNFPMLTVLSYAEIAPGVDVESLGMVTVNYED
jgi:type III secretory pathway component EscV